jgi:hypothetical protein
MSPKASTPAKAGKEIEMTKHVNNDDSREVTDPDISEDNMIALAGSFLNLWAESSLRVAGEDAKYVPLSGIRDMWQGKKFHLVVTAEAYDTLFLFEGDVPGSVQFQYCKWPKGLMSFDGHTVEIPNAPGIHREGIFTILAKKDQEEQYKAIEDAAWDIAHFVAEENQ